MVDKIKILGLALGAVAAMSAATASAASAGSFDITRLTVFTGANLAGQEHQLTIPLPKIGGHLTAKCPNTSFEGTAPGLTDLTEATVTATYGGGTVCRVNGLSAAIRMNGCKYTVTGAEQAALTALVDITGCTAGKKIEVEQIATKCIVTIGEQNGLAHLTFEQNGTDAVAKAAVSNITVTQDAACPEPSVVITTASFTATTTVNAFENEGTKQVTLHNHQYAERLCGSQLELLAT